MAKIMIKAVQAILATVPRIDGRQTFSSLWHLAQALYKALRKLDHPDHPTDGWVGVLMAREEYALRNMTQWVDPEDVGQYFVMPTNAITTGDQLAAKCKWTYKNDLCKSYVALKMALKATFKTYR